MSITLEEYARAVPRRSDGDIFKMSITLEEYARAVPRRSDGDIFKMSITLEEYARAGAGELYHDVAMGIYSR